jgi:hypothetical protein
MSPFAIPVTLPQIGEKRLNHESMATGYFDFIGWV